MYLKVVHPVSFATLLKLLYLAFQLSQKKKKTHKTPNFAQFLIHNRPFIPKLHISFQIDYEPLLKYSWEVVTTM